MDFITRHSVKIMELSIWMAIAFIPAIVILD
jgi:hypothetical protein